MRGPGPPAVLRPPGRRDETGAGVLHAEELGAVNRPPARIILAAAEAQNSSEVARRLGTSAATARHRRDRWVGLEAVPAEDLGAEAAPAYAPRPGRPAGSPRAGLPGRCAACEAPAAFGRPIGHRTGARPPARSSATASSIASRPATLDGP